MDKSRLITGAACEIRAAEEGPRLHGTLIQEGRAASGGRRELFTPGSIEWPSEGIGILLQHRAAPEARAVPERLPDGRITVSTLATDAIREAVSSGRRYMSVEFHSLRERTTRGGVREIQRAYVPDAALVDSPEYDVSSAEVRQRGYGTTVSTGRRMDCRCAGQGADVASIEFEAGAFTRLLREVSSGRRDVSAISRGAGDVVATTGTGSLELSAVAAGLAVTMHPLDTEAGRRAEELIEAGVDVYARPIIDFDSSDFVVRGGAAVVGSAIFSHVLVKPVDRAKGLASLSRVGERRERLVTVSRRRRLWL